MSEKYPRTLHLPFSPGATSDDKILNSVTQFLKKEVIITEKVDGSNLCLTRDAVYARTHSGPPTHSSFDPAKALWASTRFAIHEDLSLFGEWCYAKHSIAYEALPAYFLLFNVRIDWCNAWLSWSDVERVATELGLKTVPVLWKGTLDTEATLCSKIQEVLAKGSQCGGEAIEGVVIRLADPIFDLGFETAKWVRKDHVKTTEHWTTQRVTPNKLRI